MTAPLQDINESVFEGSLTANNTTALSRVTPLSETSGGEDGGENVSAALVEAPPIITPGSVATWHQGGGAVAANAGLAVIATSATALVERIRGAGRLRVGRRAGGHHDRHQHHRFSYSAGTLTLSGLDTLAHYQSVLDSLTYNSTSSNPGASGASTSRTLNYSLSDGIETGTGSVALDLSLPLLAISGTVAGQGCDRRGDGQAILRR